MVRLLTLLCVLWPAYSLAQTPFIDGPFPTSSMDDDPNLIIVRENYDASKRIQSIYLRMADGSEDYEVTSGEIFFTNAEMVTLITSREALKEGDAQWGIPGVQYGRNRGLEGIDPANHIPIEDSQLDVARIQENSVRFWFGCGRDIDDFRILIRYPEENITSSMSLVLYHRRGPDVEGWPPTNDGGLQIGGLDDVTPDDGLYPNEVYSIERLKLRIEDVDIVEDTVELGTINFMGGAVGPGVMTIENQYRGTDPDGDNGRDQNGDIFPVPSTGPLNHLRYEVRPLIGPGGASIPASGIQVLGLPRSLPFAAQDRGEISVDTPADLPEGQYAGDITLWEDNNIDGEISPGEPSDRVTIVVEVRDRVDAALDSGVADALVDAVVDGMVDAEADVEPADSEVVDSQVDSHMQDMLPTDILELDARQKQPDTGDASEIPDGDGLDAFSEDAHIHPDGSPVDAMDDQDSSLDAAGLDSGDPSTPRQWPGVPQGGALMCNASDGSPFAILFFLLLTPILRRRRCE